MSYIPVYHEHDVLNSWSHVTFLISDTYTNLLIPFIWINEVLSNTSYQNFQEAFQLILLKSSTLLILFF